LEGVHHLASAFSITSADTWMPCGAVQNPNYAVGDKPELMIVTATGSPVVLSIRLKFRRASF
jgi:hypothetical protein